MLCIQIKSGSKTRIQLIESGNQITKAKFQSDSKTEVNCSKTDTILKDQIQYTEVAILFYFYFIIYIFNVFTNSPLKLKLKI